MSIEDASEKIITDILSLALCSRCRQEIEEERSVIAKAHARHTKEAMSKMIEHSLPEIRDVIQQKIWYPDEKNLQVKSYLSNLLWGIDIFINTLIGGRRETISARLARSRLQGSKTAQTVCRILDRLEPNHCEESERFWIGKRRKEHKSYGIQDHK